MAPVAVAIRSSAIGKGSASLRESYSADGHTACLRTHMLLDVKVALHAASVRQSCLPVTCCGGTDAPGDSRPSHSIGLLPLSLEKCPDRGSEMPRLLDLLRQDIVSAVRAPNMRCMGVYNWVAVLNCMARHRLDCRTNCHTQPTVLTQDHLPHCRVQLSGRKLCN